jgi:hypothetical protein
MIAGAAALTLGGCVERTLTIQSNPPNALVFMNDEEAGRTPFTRPFVWYGTYDVQVRKEGYETLKAATPVIAPWWQWVPFDFVAELIPVHLEDAHTVRYSLAPARPQLADPDALIQRGQRLREQLEFGKLGPQTRPATQSTTRPSHKQQ